MEKRCLVKSAFCLLLISGFLLISSAKAQNLIHYTFKVSTVSNVVTAKRVISIVRPYFNHEDEPQKYFPAFDESTQRFDFKSNVVVEESVLSELLMQNGYSLIDFNYEVTSEK